MKVDKSGRKWMKVDESGRKWMKVDECGNMDGKQAYKEVHAIFTEVG